MSIYVRPARWEDTALLAPRLRAADAAEVRARSGHDPREALAIGFVASDAPMVIATKDDDAPIAMFGVCPGDQPLSGCVWMLGADELEKHSWKFLRECRSWLRAFHQYYPLLYNHIDARNTLHIRWLRWCGFTFIAKHENFGAEQRPFLEFVRINQPCANQSLPRLR